QVVNSGAGETTYYVYDASGQRARKVTSAGTAAATHETIYLGAYEVYRKYHATGATTLEGRSLHVADDQHRIAIVETQLPSPGSSASTSSTTTIRYQLANHLG